MCVGRLLNGEQELEKRNPLLQTDAFPFAVARRHFMIEFRVERLCTYMTETNTSTVVDYFARVSIERNRPEHHSAWPESMFGKQTMRHALPSLVGFGAFPQSHHQWYAMPYPGLYSGAPGQSPASRFQELRHNRTFLWTYVGGSHGMAQTFRKEAIAECRKLPDVCFGNYEHAGKAKHFLQESKCQVRP